ncbi:MAG: nicotinate (nicotinamide) nucleotide adenylyltransferase [Muribaculaceae bacterium]|nr:nicotinate (nicotinamide) nucleotide adenylyltransferase [Muribaculaceae bacterium]
MKRVGILGGSFNPVHTGHLILADFIRQEKQLDEVWFMLSPMNPFKQDSRELLNEEHRMEMLRLAIEPSLRLKISNFELNMPRPSYTVDTLRELHRHFTDTRFSLIIGADNYASFDRWKKPDEIMSMVDIIVYPRPGVKLPPITHPSVTFVDAPLLDISSTMIRNLIARGREVNFMVPDKVLKYINKHNLYRI